MKAEPATDGKREFSQLIVKEYLHSTTRYLLWDIVGRITPDQWSLKSLIAKDTSKNLAYVHDDPQASLLSSYRVLSVSGLQYALFRLIEFYHTSLNDMQTSCVL